MDHLQAMHAKGRNEGRHVRGPVDHGFIHSIYFRDPNGYVVELAAPTGHNQYQSEAVTRANSRDVLTNWSNRKAIMSLE